MQALIYLIDSLLALAVLVTLLRLLLQWSRADFRNPLARAVVNLSNPLIVPLRRIIPAIGRLDTATAVVLLVLILVKVAAPRLLLGAGLYPAPSWALLAAMELARTVLWTYFVCIFIYALLSLIAPGTYSPAQALLVSLCEPILRPLRRIIPPISGMDLSPLWAGLLIQTVLILLR
ncbi:MAG: YggT family protein [Steroidobacteraceae bacterium]